MKILTALIIFSALACSNVEVEESANKLGDTFSLKANESKKLTDNQVVVEAKVLKIADGRCPEGVQCIRAGEALVTLSMQIGDEKFDKVEVCLQCELDRLYPARETAEIKAKNKTYKLTLQDVSPAPKNNAIVNPAATLILQ